MPMSGCVAIKCSEASAMKSGESKMPAARVIAGILPGARSRWSGSQTSSVFHISRFGPRPCGTP